MDEQRNKAHKTHKTGQKAAKKDLADKKKRGIDVQPNRGSNNKAFMGAGAGSRKALAHARSVEKRENVMRLPERDHSLRTLVQEPPLLVAVVGPPGSGKSTLIRSMAKFYTNRNVTALRGAITVVAGRARRVTFMECPNTLSAMCDMAKICDLAILVVDGSFGYEMETFEFLNVAQTHGFPKVIGVVTHLDQLESTKQLKKTKKTMRHRFWHEISAGAKMVCMAPMVRGMYRASDVLKMHRLLVTTQPKMQQWRATHSCVFIDRHEDVTDPEAIRADPSVSRSIAFFGYVRGRPIRGPGESVHIPGLGDFSIRAITRQEDPCPPAESKATSQGSTLRHLGAKHKACYAPYSDVGGVVFDDDAVYIREDAERAFIERGGAGIDLIKQLKDGVAAMDDQLDQVGARERRPVDLGAMDADAASASDDDDASDASSDADAAGNARRRIRNLDGYIDGGFDEEDDDDANATGGAGAALGPYDLDSCRIAGTPADAEAALSGGTDWLLDVNRGLLKRLFVTGGFAHQRKGSDDDAAFEDGAEEGGAGDDDDSDGYESVGEGEQQDLTAYSRAAAGDDSDDDDDDTEGGYSSASGSDAAAPVTTKKGAAAATSKKKAMIAADSFSDEDDGGEAPGAQLDDDLQGMVDFFVARKAGGGGNGTASSSGAARAATAAPLVLDETEALLAAARAGTTNADDVKNALTRGEGGEEGDAAAAAQAAEDEEYIKKKMEKKRMFDEQYDTQGGRNNTTAFYQHLLEEEQERAQRINETLEEVGEDVDKRVEIVGYFSGLYVRFVVDNVPVEFLNKFNPRVPMFAGGLNPGEERLEVVHARFKRHRWFPKILKAQDPICVSIGWRRIHTQPLYATDDANGRWRYLKYTPKHMHCVATFYGPVVPPNTGFIVIPTHEHRRGAFRCMASGYTIGVDAATHIVKKLKITGTPKSIHKTTCFVKGMFTSDIEAAKFVGAKVKSVSGLRGIIKRVMKGEGGTVRCTFEDKLLLSDIVFMRTWKPVDVPRYCETVPTLLVGAEGWKGAMKTMAELRREHNLPMPSRPDSEYREVKRPRRLDADADEGKRPDGPLLSRNLRAQLPFGLKEEFIPLQRTSEMQAEVMGNTTIAPDDLDRRRHALLSVFREKSDAMQKQQRKTQQARRDRKEAISAKEDKLYEQKLKAAKKVTARKAEFRTQHKTRSQSGKK